jgi:sulfotransferase
VVVMQGIFAWLDLETCAIDPEKLRVQPHESDSHYRFKYPHATRSRIQPPGRHAVPQRFEAVLRQNFGWYYDTFYPGLR